MRCGNYINPVDLGWKTQSRARRQTRRIHLSLHFNNEKTRTTIARALAYNRSAVLPLLAFSFCGENGESGCCARKHTRAEKTWQEMKWKHSGASVLEVVSGVLQGQGMFSLHLNLRRIFFDKKEFLKQCLRTTVSWKYWSVFQFSTKWFNGVRV